ncbi:MAG: hypothetical protein ACP5OR_02035 [Candidatus Dormibacteria bacterium]
MNDIAHLLSSSMIHFIVAGCSLLNPAGCIADAAKSVLSWFLNTFNPITWIFKIIGDWIKGDFENIAKAGSTLFVGTVPPGAATMYNVLAPVGIVVAACAGGARMLRAMFDPRQDGMTMLVDVIVRFGIATLAITAGGVLYQGIVWIINGVATVSPQLVMSFAIGGTKNVPGGVFGGIANLLITAVTGVLTAGPFLLFLGIVAGIAALIGIIYVIFLWIGRIVMMIFCIATAPVCVAIAVYDQKNKFVQWWLELFLGVTIMPIIIWGTLGLTLGFDIHALVTIPFLGPIISVLMILGAFWFIGKMINKLVWSGYSHGSAMGAITAAAGAVMALPSAANDISIVGRMAGVKSAAQVAAAGGKPSAVNKAMGLMDRAAGAGVSRFGSGPFGSTEPSVMQGRVGQATSALKAMTPEQKSALGSNLGNFRDFAVGVATKLQPEVADRLLNDPETFNSMAMDAFMQGGSAGVGGYNTPDRVNSIHAAAADISGKFLGTTPSPGGSSGGGGQPKRLIRPGDSDFKIA